ncbi:MAG: heavy-metal-associated domain-containing protein [Candidatus Izemoplasmataceae bacterium]|uniref:heavy-metal-associated domain-containing protein n=1 Tax=Liberiplasma polymorphum TaxID=3374570 RepID=UPI003773E842
MEKITIYIANLTCPGCDCGSCAATLIRALEQLEHVVKVEPDFSDKTISLTMSPINIDNILDVINHHQYKGEIL